MSAPMKKRPIVLLPLLCLALVPLVSYFTLDRNRKVAGAATTKPVPATTKSLNSIDADNDGIPDTAELQSFMDRENFRQWFTLIAEAQFYNLSEQWNSDQRDCAGLVRFAWREALRRHDRTWFQKMGPGYSAIAPDVAHYSLEQGPLGEKLFRGKVRLMVLVERQSVVSVVNLSDWHSE